MNIARQVHRIYETYPFPATDEHALKTKWTLAPPDWISAISSQEGFAPRRILVAGCGTGAEAFNLQRQFASAEIVAVDFSSRSIAAAKKLQSRSREMRAIRLVVGDLTKPLPNGVGRNFDFISCNGVLSHIPQPARAVRNLARSLNSDGVVFVGVSGAANFCARWRPALAAFGFSITEFRDRPDLRKILELYDALELSGDEKMARKIPAYLAQNLFGPLIHNLSLAEWVRMFENVDLHFLGSYSARRGLWAAANAGLAYLFRPRSRAEVSRLIDLLRPAEVHSLLFSRRPELNPPWENFPELLEWRPRLTAICPRRFPTRQAAWHKIRTLKIISRSTNTLIELKIPEWEVEILRQANGGCSLTQMLEQIPTPASLAPLRDVLYLLYQLALIDLVPPILP